MSTTAAHAAEAARSLVAKDSAHLAAMMAARQIVLLKAAARARVLLKDGATIQVRLTDPAALGLERWIPHQFCS